MKRIFIAVLAAISFGACDQIPAGEYTTEYKDIDATYASLDVSGAFDVTYSASADKMEICAQENVHDYIAIETIGKTLKLYVKPNRIMNLKEIEVILPASSSLTEIKLSGASVFSSDETLSGTDFSVDLSGSSLFKSNIVTSESIDISLSGASLLASRLHTSDLKVSLGGSSCVNLSGKAVDCTLSMSGASALEGNDDAVLNVVNAVRCDLSGACSAEIACDGSIKGGLSGASTIKYHGSATIDVETSGSSSVTHD